MGQRTHQLSVMGAAYRFSSVCGGWMMCCREVIMAADGPHIAMQCMTLLTWQQESTYSLYLCKGSGLLRDGAP